MNNKTPGQPESPAISQAKPETIRGMFDDIARTYDTLNHVLSFGLDIAWRRRALKLLEEKRGGIFLDIACGSGDFSLDAMTLSPKLIVGCDFSLEMLRVFKKKKTSRDPIEVVSADAMRLPFRDNSFDVTMVAFGIRNFADRPMALREMARVLKPGGLALILELTEPRHRLIKPLYAFHSRAILPMLGRIISRHSGAYRYLPDSISKFPPAEAFVETMRVSGFEDARAIPLTFGVATVFVGRKGIGD